MTAGFKYVSTSLLAALALSSAVLARIDELTREWNGTDTSYVR